MAKVLPFKGLRYNPMKIKDLSKVMAPPYDILSAREQDFYYGLHSNNIVKLDFGKEMAGDTDRVNKYTRAATLLRLWTDQGILKPDAKPAVYVYSQSYSAPDGSKKTFLGALALLKLEPYASGVVRPHEKTLSKAKADRLELTRATRANLSPIFMLLDDPRLKYQKWLAARAQKKPAFDFKTGDGVRHCLWVVDSKPKVTAFQKLFNARPVYIADGHHRYETMLNYAAEQAKKKAQPAFAKAAALAMVCFTPLQSPGLVVLPTHRQLFGLNGFSSDGFQRSLAQYFDLKPFPSLEKLQPALARAGSRGPSFGLSLPGGALLLLTFKKGVDPALLVKEDRSPAFKHLDVSLLQAVILQGLLGLTAESIAAQQNIHYTKSAPQAVESVAKGRYQCAFLLNATPITAVRDISDQKDVLPQKSTYFLPKLLTGLVLRKIE